MVLALDWEWIAYPEKKLPDDGVSQQRVAQGY